jgi:thiamine pyrophosphate-dependent acetolactate synthase large subunit-like protein
MKWFERLWKSPARRYLLIGVLVASGVGVPAAVGIATGIDEGITEVSESQG